MEKERKLTNACLSRRKFYEALKEAEKATGAKIANIYFSEAGKTAYTGPSYTNPIPLGRKKDSDIYGICSLGSVVSTFIITGEEFRQKIRAPKDMEKMFAGFGSNDVLPDLQAIYVNGLDVSSTTNFRACFAHVGTVDSPFNKGVKINGLQSWNTSKASIMTDMFMYYNCNAESVFLDLSHFNTRSVRYFDGMFDHCGCFTPNMMIEGPERWDMTNAIECERMFDHFGAKADYLLDCSAWKGQYLGKTCNGVPTYSEGEEPIKFKAGVALKIKSPDWTQKHVE